MLITDFLFKKTLPRYMRQTFFISLFSIILMLDFQFSLSSRIIHKNLTEFGFIISLLPTWSFGRNKGKSKFLVFLQSKRSQVFPIFKGSFFGMHNSVTFFQFLIKFLNKALIFLCEKNRFVLSANMRGSKMLETLGRYLHRQEITTVQEWSNGVNHILHFTHFTHFTF